MNPLIAVRCPPRFCHNGEGWWSRWRINAMQMPLSHLLHCGEQPPAMTSFQISWSHYWSVIREEQQLLLLVSVNVIQMLIRFPVLIFFWHKKHLVRVRKTSWLKYLFQSPQKRLGMSPGLLPNVQWCDSNCCQSYWHVVMPPSHPSTSWCERWLIINNVNVIFHFWYLGLEKRQLLT